jgi:7-carboxy-7-deazaguanine synthase
MTLLPTGYQKFPLIKLPLVAAVVLSGVNTHAGWQFRKRSCLGKPKPRGHSASALSARYNGRLTRGLRDLQHQRDFLHLAGRRRPRRAGRRCFAASPAATCGPGAKRSRASAVCTFCDTDFVGTDGERGGKFRDAAALAAEIDSLWPASHAASKYVVFTGGEPLLQLDEALIAAMHAHGFTIAIETNGTLPVPPGVDWICVSPKMGSKLVVEKGNEIKVVIPQANQDLAAYEHLDFDNFFVQPMDGLLAAPEYAPGDRDLPRNPKWKLSLQTHKLLQIP